MKKLSTQRSKSRYIAVAKKLSVALKRYEKKEENAKLCRSAWHFFRLVSSRLRSKENNIAFLDEKVDILSANGDICKTFLEVFKNLLLVIRNSS